MLTCGNTIVLQRPVYLLRLAGIYLLGEGFTGINVLVRNICIFLFIFLNFQIDLKTLDMQGNLWPIFLAKKDHFLIDTAINTPKP